MSAVSCYSGRVLTSNKFLLAEESFKDVIVLHSPETLAAVGVAVRRGGGAGGGKRKRSPAGS